MSFQVDDTPEWGTLEKNLDRVGAIDRWFQGRFLAKKVNEFRIRYESWSMNHSS